MHKIYNQQGPTQGNYIQHLTITYNGKEGFPGGASGKKNPPALKNPPAIAGDIRDTDFISRSEDPLEESMAAHSSK